MEYTIEEYRRGYTIWAAYRAAQAGSSKAKGPEFSSALKSCGVIEFFQGYSGSCVTEAKLNARHREWCWAVMDHLEENYQKEVSYGIAAKLIAVFLKGDFILSGHGYTPLGRIVHPPIDSFLLKGVDSAMGTKLCSTYKWQKLDEDTYFELLSKLRQCIESDVPFWHIEQYWELN